MDTLNPEKKVKDLMLLQIGNQRSKYFPFSTYLSDSALHILVKKSYDTGQRVSEQEIFTEIKKHTRASMANDFTLFKHYPQKGQLTFMQYFGFDNNEYEEAVPDFHWKLSNDTLTVCEYLCTKATTTFRGRNYKVWYTKEIPVSDGPWKFNGLPGLILKAIDEQGFFSFECTAIEIPSGVKSIYNISYGRKISRNEFNKAMQRFMDNMGAYSTGSPLTPESPFPASAYKKRPYNPIERTDE
ncbi:hypothetical protein FACS1894177_05910 [Bacteroidia bacterium]|nr:hypothetical protein FACS1894177_05910 [Bacteroidia bacterium]